MRRKFFIKVLSSFLCIGIILALFHISGNVSFFNDSSNIIFKGIVTHSLQFFIIIIDILSYKCDLLESDESIIGSEFKKEFIRVLVLYKRGGNTLVIHCCFFIAVHVEAIMLQ